MRLPFGHRSHTDYSRWRDKHTALEGLCSRHDLVAVQETRGGEGDLAMLPGHFERFGPFFPIDQLAMGSCAGGVAIGVRRAYKERFDDVRLHEVFARLRRRPRIAPRRHPNPAGRMCAPPCTPGGQESRWLFFVLTTPCAPHRQTVPTVLLGDRNFTSEQSDRFPTADADMHLPAAADDVFGNIF